MLIFVKWILFLFFIIFFFHSCILIHGCRNSAVFTNFCMTNFIPRIPYFYWQKLTLSQTKYTPCFLTNLSLKTFQLSKFQFRKRFPELENGLQPFVNECNRYFGLNSVFGLWIKIVELKRINICIFIVFLQIQGLLHYKFKSNGSNISRQIIASFVMIESKINIF